MIAPTCPRCQAELPPPEEWTPLGVVGDDYQPAYAIPHRRPGGGWCKVYSGPRRAAGYTAGTDCATLDPQRSSSADLIRRERP